MARLIAQRQEEPVEDEIMAKRDADTPSSGPEVGVEGGPISGELSSRINAKRGGGAALDSAIQSRMETAFGSDFSDVRVHADAESDALNRSVSARAFTTGSDIFFSHDANPSDTSLLAHELTHVVQQRVAPPAGGQMTVSPAQDLHEAAADAAASAVAIGGAVSSAQRLEDPALTEIARQEVPEEEELPV